ncbi:site-2 protease family protein, partial [Myxococcota bacterium]
MASIFWFIVLIGILIFAHEGGHFLFAKLFKVRVITFSLGFGSPIRFGKFKLSWKPGETEYRIAWFPAGGFVRMLGDDPTEEVPEEDRARAFSTQAAGKRFLIILGGPLFSVLLAIPIYFITRVVDDRAPAPIVGKVVPGSPAEQAGLMAKDVLVQVGDNEIDTWEDVEAGTQASAGAEVEVVVERDDQRHSYTIKPREELDETGLQLLGQRWDLGILHRRQGNIIGVVADDSPAGKAGLRSWDRILEVCGVPVEGWWDVQRILGNNGDHLVPVTVVRASELRVGAITIKGPVLVDTFILPAAADQAPEGAWRTGTAYLGLEPVDLYVHKVTKGKPGEKLGIRPGDKILSVYGRPITGWDQFSRAILENPEGPIPLQIRSRGEIRRIDFVPEVIKQPNEFKQSIRKLGLGVEYLPNLLAGKYAPRKNRFLYATGMAFVDTGMSMYMNVIGFVRIFQGRVKASEAIGGPIMILDIAGKSAEKGWLYFVKIMAFLSVLLGLLNLLPIPILDGGHIAFIGIEAVMRRPVSIKARLIASYVGLILLVGLMVFAFGNDIHRYWS